MFNLILPLILLTLPLFDPNAEMLVQLDDLIVVTEDNLTLLKKLKEQITDFQKTQNSLIEQPNNQALLSRTSVLAYQILSQIKQKELLYLFPKELLKELELFAKFATSTQIPRP